MSGQKVTYPEMLVFVNQHGAVGPEIDYSNNDKVVKAYYWLDDEIVAYIAYYRDGGTEIVIFPERIKGQPEMNEMYFVINNSDGDTYVQMLTKEELVKRLNEEYYGSDPIFLDKIPSNMDTNYWGEGILIIKGAVTVPQPVQIVTEYAL